MSSSYLPPTLTAPDSSSFEQRLAVLDEALPAADDSARALLRALRASVVRVRKELAGIHVPSLLGGTSVRPACFDCGTKNLEVFYTSKHGQYHLCAPCFGVRVSHGRAQSPDEPAQAVSGEVL